MQDTVERIAADERRAYIDRLIAAAPPPTPEQVARVCAALKTPPPPTVGIARRR